MTTVEYNKKGGISRCVAELAEHFAGEHEVHVYSIKWRDVYNKKIIFHKVPGLSGSSALSLTLFAIQNTSRFKSLRSEYDIIHTNGADSNYQDIVTAHSCHRAWVDQYNSEKGRAFSLRPADWAVLAIEKNNYGNRNYKKIIAISEGVKREIVHYYNVPPEDIVVIPNGVDLEEFKPDMVAREQIRTRLKINENELILLFSSYEFHRKGLRFVIEALQKLPGNVKLLVIGKDNPVPYIKLAAELGVKDRIIFTGFVESINSYFAASDIFVFPTTYEPFGLVITEAMASGLPVITSKTAGAAELMTDGHDGLLLNAPHDAGEISDRINLLVEDEALRKRMGKNARTTAEKYSWDENARRTFAVYQEISKA